MAEKEENMKKGKKRKGKTAQDGKEDNLKTEYDRSEKRG
jgi:hypothetical protein